MPQRKEIGKSFGFECKDTSEFFLFQNKNLTKMIILKIFSFLDMMESTKLLNITLKRENQDSLFGDIFFEETTLPLHHGPKRARKILKVLG